MGWGAKGVTPQPTYSPHRIEQTAVIEEPVDTPDLARVAELEFMQLQANKGWMPERRYDVLRDFIRSVGLYPDLNKFVRKMR
jgi:hypothetical protein